MTARSGRRWGAPAAAVLLDAGWAVTAYPRPQQLAEPHEAGWRLAAARGLGRASLAVGSPSRKAQRCSISSAVHPAHTSSTMVECARLGRGEALAARGLARRRAAVSRLIALRIV